jgi:hypothetical protein
MLAACLPKLSAPHNSLKHVSSVIYTFCLKIKTFVFYTHDLFVSCDSENRQRLSLEVVLTIGLSDGDTRFHKFGTEFLNII